MLVYSVLWFLYFMIMIDIIYFKVIKIKVSDIYNLLKYTGYSHASPKDQMKMGRFLNKKGYVQGNEWVDEWCPELVYRFDKANIPLQDAMSSIAVENVIIKGVDSWQILYKLYKYNPSRAYEIFISKPY